MSNTTRAMPLTEFLLARVAEDERRVEFVRDFIPDEGNQGEYIDPARVLAECEAKRRIVALAVEAQQRMMDGPPLHDSGTFHAVSAWMRDVLCKLAAVYSDHPDYREEWRP